MRKLHGTILLVLLAIGRASGAPPDDAFNQQRLKTGQDLYREKRYLDAIPQFDVAAFGYLDRPANLSECLVWLALAQNAAGRTKDVDATLLRFLEVERRFPSYAKLNLPPEIRTEFRALLVKRVAEPTIQSIPSLAGTVETKAQKLAQLPPAQRRTAYEAAARAEPTSAQWPAALARDAAGEGDWKSAEKWANQALSLDASNTDAVEIRARARAARRDYRGALADLGVLPAAEWEKTPDLYVVQFVALVETGDWKGAEDAERKVPATMAGRSDVAAARQKLAAQRQAQERAAGVAASAAAKASPKSPDHSAATMPAPSAATNPPAAKPTPPPAPGRSEASAAAVPGADATAKSGAALAEGRRLIAAGKSSQAEALLSDALRTDPTSRELRLALLEAACLSRSYKTALAQIPLVEPFGDIEAPSMFYAAVVLYESGHAKEARSYFERAAPRVSGPLVDEYSKKIMGQD